MLQTWWTIVSEAILSLGGWGVVAILILAFFHPTLEAPAAILLLTVLSVLMQSVWLASLILLFCYLLGLIFFYYLAHRLHHRSNYMLHRFSPTQTALAWIKAQPKWKHNLIIGMPLIYTYPLRVAFTLNHEKIGPFLKESFLQYLVLTTGNLLLYFGILEIIFFQAPWWFITMVLIVVAVAIYGIRAKTKIT